MCPNQFRSKGGGQPANKAKQRSREKRQTANDTNKHSKRDRPAQHTATTTEPPKVLTLRTEGRRVTRTHKQSKAKARSKIKRSKDIPSILIGAVAGPMKGKVSACVKEAKRCKRLCTHQWPSLPQLKQRPSPPSPPRPPSRPPLRSSRRSRPRSSSRKRSRPPRAIYITVTNESVHKKRRANLHKDSGTVKVAAVHVAHSVVSVARVVEFLDDTVTNEIQIRKRKGHTMKA